MSDDILSAGSHFAENHPEHLAKVLADRATERGTPVEDVLHPKEREDHNPGSEVDKSETTLPMLDDEEYDENDVLADEIIAARARAHDAEKPEGFHALAVAEADARKAPEAAPAVEAPYADLASAPQEAPSAPLADDGGGNHTTVETAQQVAVEAHNEAAEPVGHDSSVVASRETIGNAEENAK